MLVPVAGLGPGPDKGGARGGGGDCDRAGCCRGRGCMGAVVVAVAVAGAGAGPSRARHPGLP